MPLESHVLAAIAGIARALAFLSVSPVLSEYLPQRARLSLAVLLGGILGATRPVEVLTVSLMCRELAQGALLGVVVAWIWSTLESAMGLAMADALNDDEVAIAMSRAAGLASFLALGGDHALITLLAGPGVELSLDSLGALLHELVRALGVVALGALAPLTLALAAARFTMGLALRACSVDLGGPAQIGLGLAGMILVSAWLPGVVALYQGALERAGAVLMSAVVSVRPSALPEDR